MTADEYRVDIWSEENVLKLLMMVAQLCEYTRTTELYTWKEWILWYMGYINKNLERSRTVFIDNIGNEVKVHRQHYYIHKKAYGIYKRATRTNRLI